MGGYEENTSTLGTTESVEDFWRLYVHLRRPVDDRPTVCDYHVFREGIKPMWEDESNVNGGKYRQIEKGRRRSLLGRPALRAAGGAVQGGRRDLRGRALRALPGGHPLHLEQVCRQPASVHADQDDAVQRAAAADGRLARVQEA